MALATLSWLRLAGLIDITVRLDVWSALHKPAAPVVSSLGLVPQEPKICERSGSWDFSFKQPAVLADIRMHRSQILLLSDCIITVTSHI